jgi:NADPH:quinone reductase
MTSAIGLYLRLRLPLPWLPAKEPLPLIVYGAASAVGAFAIQLANLSNIHPLICVAGNGAPFVEKLIDRSKGDTIVDYRGGDEAVVQGIRKALNGETVAHAFDAVSEKGSYRNICQVLDQKKGNITLVLPGKKYEEIPPSIERSLTAVGSTHEELKPDTEAGKLGLKTNTREFAFTFFRLFGRGLQDGWFKGHPYEVVPGGLEGVETALKNLKGGKPSAVKYVFRIAETPGVKALL